MLLFSTPLSKTYTMLSRCQVDVFLVFLVLLVFRSSLFGCRPFFRASHRRYVNPALILDSNGGTT